MDIMDIIVLMVTAAAICVTLGGLGLHYETKKRLDEIEGAIEFLDKDTRRNNRDIKILKDRAAQNSDRAYIVNIPMDDDQVKYGGF